MQSNAFMSMILWKILFTFKVKFHCHMHYEHSLFDDSIEWALCIVKWNEMKYSFQIIVPIEIHLYSHSNVEFSLHFDSSSIFQCRDPTKTKSKQTIQRTYKNCFFFSCGTNNVVTTALLLCVIKKRGARRILSLTVTQRRWDKTK